MLISCWKSTHSVAPPFSSITSNSHPTYCPSKAAKMTNQYVFTLMMETAMFAETLDNF
jgi:hypothetical protein